MSVKKFNAVEMKRKGATRIHQRTRKMTPAEELKYWQQRSAAFREEQSRLASPTKSKRKAG